MSIHERMRACMRACVRMCVKYPFTGTGTRGQSWARPFVHPRIFVCVLLFVCRHGLSLRESSE